MKTFPMKLKLFDIVCLGPFAVTAAFCLLKFIGWFPHSWWIVFAPAAASCAVMATIAVVARVYAEKE